MVVYHIVQHTLYIIKRVLEFRWFLRRNLQQRVRWEDLEGRNLSGESGQNAFPKIPTKLEGERNYHIFVGFRFRGGFYVKWQVNKNDISQKQTRFVGRFLDKMIHPGSTFVRLIQNTAGGGVPPMTKGWISAMIQTVKNSSGWFYAQWVQPGFCPIFFIQKQSMAEIFKSLPQNMVVSCDLRATFFFLRNSKQFPYPFEVGDFWDPAFWGKTRFLKRGDPREFKHRFLSNRIRRQKLAKVLPRASPKSSRKKSLLGKETSMTWYAAVLLDEVWKSGSCWENPCWCLCFLMVPYC